MVDININVPAVEKLIDYCASGIGAIAGPMLAKRKAQSEADVQRIKAQGATDTIRLMANAQNEAREQFNGFPSSIQSELEVGEQIKVRIAFQEEKRQRNIQSVVSMAAEEIKDKEVQEHEIDHDWTARFFSDVQDVSSEQMQTIWARILAGEVEAPGRTSLRTLNILKNMTQKDAELFDKAAQFVICDIIFRDSATNNIDGFPSYAMFLQLESYGLVHAGASLGKIVMEEHVFADKFRIYRISEINLHADDNWKCDIPCYALTSAGRELYQFVEAHPSMGYLSMFANFLNGENTKLEYVDIPRNLHSMREGDKVDIPKSWTQVQPHIPNEQETKS